MEIHITHKVESARRLRRIELHRYVNIGGRSSLSVRRRPEQRRRYNTEPQQLGAVLIQFGNNGVPIHGTNIAPTTPRSKLNCVRKLCARPEPKHFRWRHSVVFKQANI